MNKKIFVLGIILITCISTLSTVSASDAPERIYIDDNYYFTYYSFDSAPGKADYFEGIDAYDDTFYFTMPQSYKMLEYSPIFNQMIIYGDKYEFGDDVDITNVFGQKIGGIHEDKGTFSFDVKVDKPFSFTWSGGHKVGLNDDAKQIETIYDADGKVIYQKWCWEESYENKTDN